MTERVPLLLHSLSDLHEVWFAAFDAAQVQSVTEIGAETGVTTRLLVRWFDARDGGRVITVDPAAPGVPAAELPANVKLTVVRGYSPDALDGLAATDAYLIDGDHNWHTVSRELEAIETASGDGPLPLLVLHDVGWPAGRRDEYYAPERLPAEAVHPHTREGGVRPGEPGIVVEGGFRGNDEFAVARREGGPRNGVLTAVEDFLAGRDHLELLVVPAIFGLGFVLDARCPHAERVRVALAPYAGHGLLARMEENRLDLYLAVLALQDQLARTERERVRLHARLAELRAARDTVALAAAHGASGPLS